MSGGLDVLALKEEDVTLFLAANTHLGATNSDFQMEQYISKKKADGTNIINLRKTWEKLLLAARAIAAVENPADVCVISARPYAQRAILKFAVATGVSPIAGRFTPGTFTNQIQAAFREPRLLIVSDPRVDHQAVNEASYVNIPVIALANMDSRLRCVDIAIPCNNKAPHSLGLMFWMLAREVLRLRGTISREVPWDVMVDLYFFRESTDADKEEQAGEVKAVEEKYPQEQWNEPATIAQNEQWTEPGVAPATGFGAAPAEGAQEDWSATDTGDWSATGGTPAAAAGTTTAPPATEAIKDWGGAKADDWS